MIKPLTPEVQRLVDLEYAKRPSEPSADDTLGQVNLRHGDRVVYEYLDDGQPGLAADHLTYMIQETELELTPEMQAAMARISALT